MSAHDAIEQRVEDLRNDPEMLTEALQECWDGLTKKHVAALALRLTEGKLTPAQDSAYREFEWALAELDYARDDRSWAASRPLQVAA